MRTTTTFPSPSFRLLFLPMPILLAAFLLAGSAVPAMAQAGGHEHAAGAPGAAGASPYAGLQDREIKALSAEELSALQAGDGIGFALAAELNGYPGPKHVLELADSLGLSAEQRAETERVRAEMLAEARRLGAALVEAERALDRAFADETVTAEALGTMTEEVGRLEGALRAAHLRAHVAMKALLSEHQAHRYDALRGY